eukprot:PLAT1517.1.p1 GENE.PLAT1517.1~~PLAT1517.1.p1  ORF type:complete len:227 (+),score=86.38 PLAT1517.1:345-1025(+)
MVDCLLWRTLSVSDVDALCSADEAAACKSLLRKLLVAREEPERELPLDEERSEVLLDFYFYNLAFARGASFTAEKISVFLAVMREVLLEDVNCRWRTMAESFAHLKQLLLRHAVARPPKSAAILARKDVAAVLDFVSDSYYRHFRLYRYAFAPRIQLTLLQRQPCDIDSLPVPARLMEALPAELSEERRIELAVARKLAARKAAMEAEAEAEEAALLARIAELEGK